LGKRKGFLIGTPDVIIEKLKAYLPLDVELAILMFPYGREFESIKIVKKHIFPALEE